jgi:hypothetical protein
MKKEIFKFCFDLLALLTFFLLLVVLMAGVLSLAELNPNFSAWIDHVSIFMAGAGTLILGIAALRAHATWEKQERIKFDHSQVHEFNSAVRFWDMTISNFINLLKSYGLFVDQTNYTLDLSKVRSDQILFDSFTISAETTEKSLLETNEKIKQQYTSLPLKYTNSQVLALHEIEAISNRLVIVFKYVKNPQSLSLVNENTARAFFRDNPMFIHGEADNQRIAAVSKYIVKSPLDI